MLVAFDAGPCHTNPTGVGVYVRDLGMALRALSPGTIAFVGVRPGGPLAGTPAPHTTFPGGSHQSWLQTRAARDIRAVKASLAHFTNAAAPLHSPVPYVLTVQDLSVVRHPLWHPVLRLATVPILLASIYRARAIIVPSHVTRRELERLVPLSVRRRVVVIPHAPSAELAIPSSAEITAAKRRFALADRPYIVSVGTLEPRKNHRRLVQAFERLSRADGDLALVLIGARGWGEERLRRQLRGSPVADRVIVSGYLDHHELAGIVAGADAFAYVSLYEGYGLPVIEAMGLGVPVVTSNRSSMPEVAGDAAVLVDPLDPRSIAAGIELARRDTVRLVQAGRARHALRSWRDVAGETLDVYAWAAST